MVAVVADAFDPRFGEGWNEQQIVGALASADRVGEVALADERVIGFSLARHAADEAELLLVAVARAWQRRGIAASLLARATEDVRNRGAATMFLEVRDANTPAAALYRALGFEAVGRRKGYYGGNDRHRHDAITMRRTLADAR